MKAVLFSKLIWGMLAGVAVGFWLGWMGRSSHDWLTDYGRAGAIGGTVGLLVGIVLDYAKLPSLGFMRRLHFGLRTLFVVVTVVCVWLGYSMNWIRQRHEILREKPRSVTQGYTDAPMGLWLFGEVGHRRILYRYPHDQQWVERLERLFPEARVEFIAH